MALAASFSGCGKPPKQADAPVIEDTGSADMGAPEEKEVVVPKKTFEEMGPADKKKICCAQCEKGLAEDKTGESPDKIPCADYAASGEVREKCVDYFRNTPLKAGECKGQGGEVK